VPGILTVVSQKGGVGKTTSAVNLAACLAQRGVKTLLVDVDPQGAVRHALGIRERGRPGVSEYLTGESELSEVVFAASIPWLRVLTAGRIAEEGNHDDYERLLADSPRIDEMVTRAADRGHVVIIDAPPGLNKVTHRLLDASTHVLVPVQAEPLALQTAAQLLRAIREASMRNERLKLAGLLLTMVDSTSTLAERVVRYAREQFPPALLLETVIPRSVAVAEAFGAGQPLVVRTPDDPAARAYAEVADHLASQLA
jgi:chromosome partitioning protein